MAEQDQAAEQAAQGVQLNIQTIYAKDVSFEAPNSPDIFLAEYKPEINVSLQNGTKSLDNDAYEVDLKVSVTSKVGEKTAYICEVQYGAVFTVTGLNEEQLARLLRTYCPEQLFPYVREAISEIVARGGFPRFVLTPINFNALYEQGIAQAAEQAATAQTEGTA